jgi:hypothetical protein
VPLGPELAVLLLLLRAVDLLLCLLQVVGFLLRLLRAVGLLLRLLRVGWLVVGLLVGPRVVVLVGQVLGVAGPYWPWPVRVLISGALSVLP